MFCFFYTGLCRPFVLGFLSRRQNDDSNVICVALSSNKWAFFAVNGRITELLLCLNYRWLPGVACYYYVIILFYCGESQTDGFSDDATCQKTKPKTRRVTGTRKQERFGTHIDTKPSDRVPGCEVGFTYRPRFGLIT